MCDHADSQFHELVTHNVFWNIQLRATCHFISTLSCSTYRQL